MKTSCMLFLVSFFAMMISGCAGILNPQGTDVKREVNAPGMNYEYSEQCARGMCKKRERADYTGGGYGGSVFMGPGGTPMQPGGANLRPVMPDIPPMVCGRSRVTGQRLCPAQDGVIPMVPEGDMTQPGDSPNDRVESRVGTLEHRQNASDRQHLNNIRKWREHCARHPSQCKR